MDMLENLLSLEILREFVSKAVTARTYQKNLVIDEIETPNIRLWALRERLHMREGDFAKKLHISLHEYHKYERIGFPIPQDFLRDVSCSCSVPLEWLLCECSMFPMPSPSLP